uniref:Gustatory receptor n=1 Tax=Anopheles epiroticus TaxID=199890 RepID=A0A182PE79_9DIPT
MKIFQLLVSFCYLKAVLLGVVPFRLQRSTLTIEFRRQLLVYCLAIALIGPSTRFWIYMNNFLASLLTMTVTFLTIMLMQFWDVILLIVSPCYLLLHHAKVKQLFELLVQLHRNPLTKGTFLFRVWFRKCFLFNLSYDAVNVTALLLNIVLSNSSENDAYVLLLASSLLCMLTKSTVMTIMYSSAQYTHVYVVKLKQLLQAERISASPVQQEQTRRSHHGPVGLMEFYDLLACVCETLNELFGVPLFTYLIMVVVHMTIICYVTLTRLLVQRKSFEPMNMILIGMELIWTAYDLLCLMKIVGTFAKTREELLDGFAPLCHMIAVNSQEQSVKMKWFEFLATLVYLKTVLFGVVPFRLHRSTLELEFRRELSLYCFAIAFCGPILRIWTYLSTFFQASGITVAFYTAIFFEVLEVTLMIVPPCVLLFHHTKVKQLFDLLVNLHRNPLTEATFPLRRWFRKCLLFNLGHDGVYWLNVVLNVILPGGKVQDNYTKLLLSGAVSLLTKSAVLTITYCSAQYLSMALVELKNQLLSMRIASSPVHQERIRQLHHGRAGYMEFYEQLWQLCKCMNELFAVPLMIYLLISITHITFVCFIALTKVLVKLTYTNAYMIIIAAIGILWNLLDLMWLMRIVGTFDEAMEEYIMISTNRLNDLLSRLASSTDHYQQDAVRCLHSGQYGLMELYEQLWKASNTANELFGPPLLAYLATAFLRNTMMYYALWYRLASVYNDSEFSFTAPLALIDVFWVTVDLLFLMRVVGSCGQMQQELINDKVVNGMLLFSTFIATVLGYLTVVYDRKRQELRVSTFLVIYSIVIAILCTSTYQSTQFLFSDTRYQNGFRESAVNKTISAIQGQVVLHTFLTALVRRYKKRYEIAQLMRDLFQLKRELFSATELSQRWMKLRILRKITISQLIVMGSFGLATLEVIATGEEGIAGELISLCIFYYPKVTVICSVSLYYAVMMFLQNLHFALNERLKQLVVENARGSGDDVRGYARMQHSVYVRSKLNYLTDARCRIMACCAKTHNLYQQMLLSCNFLCMTFIVSQSRKTQKLLLRLNLSPMDHKLKQSIAASVTNYLIILIQFEMAIEQ